MTLYVVFKLIILLGFSIEMDHLSDDELDEYSFDDSDEEDDDNENEKEQSEMGKFYEYLKKNRPALQNDNLDDYTTGTATGDDVFDEAEQQTFDYFKKKTDSGEVLRYKKDWFLYDNSLPSHILWISNKNKLDLDEDIPKCGQCGGKRMFEFQIMPRLLNFILANRVESDPNLDWGTLLVFSCVNSCTPSRPENAYVEEFIYNQPIA